MTTAASSTIGPFKLDRELGRGGMGVVYLATDTRLDRAVAIKALPEHVEADPDRLARFQREAKVLATLNHPNIGAIYGFEEVAGRRYIVLEYVEGDTLADRLKRGPIPIDEAVSLARQIAQALEAAHEKGIVHRDLKPGNVMITPGDQAKVLDFGLARTADGPPSSTSHSPVITESPTLTTPAPIHSPTIPGAIMGSAGYMSPEQARGKPVDKRSDIFSFGCVLYEMLTGAQPFSGETATDSIGAILHKDPNWSRLPPRTPPRLRELLAKCLVKDRHQRLHDIGDARIELERAGLHEPAVAATPARHHRERAAWLVALIAIALAAGAWLLRPSAPNDARPQVLRFSVPAPPGTVIEPESVNVALSPDGRRVAFLASEPGRPSRLWVRDFDALKSRVIEGTEGAAMPFWSPDSQTIAFFAKGSLCRVAASGGLVQSLADAPGARGGAWGAGDIILFAPLSNGPLYTVAASGGTATPATELDPAVGETGHRFPQFLPGGRRFLYASLAPREQRTWTEFTRLGSLDTREHLDVCTAAARATFAEPGWLLMERAGNLYAQRFDPATGDLSGPEILTGINPEGQDNFGGRFSVSASPSGAIACILDGRSKADIVEVAADGRIARTITAQPAPCSYIAVAPNGESLVAVVQLLSGKSELRLFDLVREGVGTRLVENPNIRVAAWTPDSQHVYFSADVRSRDLFRCAISSIGEPELVLKSGNLWAAVKDVSADQQRVLYTIMDPRNGRDLWLFDTTSDAPRPFANGPANEFEARLSPDGRLLALATDESGRPELYVQEFPEGRSRTRVSVSGLGISDAGTPSDASIQWSRDGASIMFLDADGRTIHSAAITRTPALSAAKPETIMKLPPGLTWVSIAPGGKSVFAASPAPGQSPPSIAVTLNWNADLKLP